MKFVHTADTHLGFEIARTPLSDPEGRHRRASWIFENFKAVVGYALEMESDLFIHSGDLFNKYYIPRERADELILPLAALDQAGIPVLLIPGNHERSSFPFDLFHGKRNVFVFDRPKSLSLDLDGYSVGVAGFPFIPKDSRWTFLRALEETEYATLRSDLNLLVTHQAFDQATVGPADFTFHAGRQDTVSRHTIPTDLDYIAAGHIHRYQVLAHPLKPGLSIVYPGSIQRMSFAEWDEDKGFVEGETRNGRIETRFVPLQAYDMEMVEIEAAGLTTESFLDVIRGQFWRFSDDRVIRFTLTGGEKSTDYPAIDFKTLRREMPDVLECQFVKKVGKKAIVCNS